jgi:hypothetical protein
MGKHLRKIDVRQMHRELYRATRSVQEVEAGRAMFLAFDGSGPPGGQAYQETIGKLYALVYTTKFDLKCAGALAGPGNPGSACTGPMDVEPPCRCSRRPA